ncbi:MAG TPA: FHA domain-containing protein [Acidimicrobiia bacterium]|jgi:pSer/pThr/pTyr-binding forkhead associated (FHA) protein
MPEGVLTVLKFCFLALLYLFLFRVVRVVVREMKASKVPVSVATPAPIVAPAAQQRQASGSAPVARLRIVEPDLRRGETIQINGEVTVGRAPGCGVMLADDSFASQVHARLYERNGELHIEDLGSTNGTFVNNERLTSPAKLRRGDRVQFGQTVAEITR